MAPASPELLIASLAQALETTAFIALEPPDVDILAPDQATLVAMDIGSAGCLLLAAPSRLGVAIAANMLALEPESAEALQRAEDALKEILNVTAGLYLSRAVAPEEPMPNLSLPGARSLAGPEAWQAWVREASATVVHAEGLPVAIALRGPA